MLNPLDAGAGVGTLAIGAFDAVFDIVPVVAGVFLWT